MRTEISRDSYQSEKRYSGVYQQQGRMLTDADWNELVEILKERLKQALKDVVGSSQGSMGGTPHHRALGLVDDGSIKIQPGQVYINGMAATLPGSTQLALDAQPDFPKPPTPGASYLLYADVWERSVTHLLDEDLRDQGLHGADTCSRKQMMAQIKWCPVSIDPEQSVTNPGKGDARLTLKLIDKTTDPDSCDPCAEKLNLETRVGNYLFRVEVHDVQGDADNPTEITLKWSSENGAEQFLALPTQNEMPAGFISDKWIYEFFDQTSERHLGVHLNDTSWGPARVELKEFNETAGAYSVPAIPGSEESMTFVRRWDGYCKINLSTGKLAAGRDRGVALSTDRGSNELGYVDIGSSLELVLESIRLQLDLSGSAFVAGDYWLAQVREAEHSNGSKLLDSKPPQGIEHFYLKLGEVTGGSLATNPELDRKYAFPSLSELTHIFISGGDGQEAMPGHQLDYPLRVDVANGEWPVSDARLLFEIEAGGGELLKPGFVATEHFETVSATGVIIHSADGICASLWRLGSSGDQRVKVTLLGALGEKLDHPPLFFSAQFSTAEEVAYTPQCPGTGVTVHSLLSDDTTSANWPALDSHGHTTVKHALDTLICKLEAGKLPYDASASQGCWQELGLDSVSTPPQTVQQAIDLLACSVHQGCCNITISEGDDIEQKLSLIADGQDAEICFKRGQHIVKNRIELANKGRIVIHGCGSASRVLAPNSESVFRIRACASIEVRDISMLSSQSGDSDQFEHLAGTLDIVDVITVNIDQVDLSCPAADAERSACCLRVVNTRQKNPHASLRLRHSRLQPGHQQIGLLMVNPGRAQVEDNEVRVRKKSAHWVLKEKLKNKDFRQTFRNILISNLSLSKTSSISGVKRNANITFEDQTVYFSTDRELVKSWASLLKNNPPPAGTRGQALVRHMRTLADTVLLNQGQVGVQAYSKWYAAMASNLPAIAHQGIVCSGRSALDIRILNNTLDGVGQGVHIGLSDDNAAKDQPDMAGRVQIRGNYITNYLSAEYRGERHGIFVGNCNSLDVESNYINVEFFPFKRTRDIEGIRVYGFSGKSLLLRHNHVSGFSTGILVRVLNTSIDEHQVWQVVSNMLEDAATSVDVNPKNQFLVEHNS